MNRGMRLLVLKLPSCSPKGRRGAWLPGELGQGVTWSSGCSFYGCFLGPMPRVGKHGWEQPRGP